MYTFKENITKKEYMSFYSQYSKASIMQDTAWAKVKDNWEHTICGLYKQKKLVAAALILMKKIPFNKYFFYVPRGFLIDYTDMELLSIFTTHLKDYAKKNKAYVIKIDPYIALSEKRVNPLSADEQYCFFSKDTALILNNLKTLGYLNNGLKRGIRDYIQPRLKMIVPLIDQEGNFINNTLFLNSLKKNVRNYLGNYHDKRGVMFTHSTDPNDLDDFLNILKKTEQRKKITLRNKAYFKKIMTAFGNRAVLFFGKLDINKYLAFIDESLLSKNTDHSFLHQQKEMALNYLTTQNKIMTIAAALVVFPANTEGLTIVEFLYAGNDTSIFPNLKVNNGLTYYRLLYSLDNKYHFANLGGIDTSLEDPLAIFKSKFNPLVVEFIGEYDLPIDKKLYVIINLFLPIIRKLMSYINKIKNKGAAYEI